MPSWTSEPLISCSNLPDAECEHEATCGNLNLGWKPKKKKFALTHFNIYLRIYTVLSLHTDPTVSIHSESLNWNLHNARCLSAQYISKGIWNFSLLSSFSRLRPSCLHSHFAKWLVTIVRHSNQMSIKLVHWFQQRQTCRFFMGRHTKQKRLKSKCQPVPSGDL